MWIDTSIIVGNQAVELSVRRLDPDACDRAAASLAWFSHLAMTGDTSTETAAWQTFMQGVIFEHVRFTVPGKTDQQLGELAAAWWDDASRQAIVAFVDTNGLASALKQHLQAIERLRPTDVARVG